MQNVIIEGVDTAVSVSGPVFTANAAGAAYSWLDCGSNMLIAGDTAQNFTAIANGDYPFW